MPNHHAQPGEDRQTNLSIVTTEHTALETARSATIFEANGRVSSYLATVSGGVVAFAFIGEAASLDQTFHLFLLVLLPILLFIGIVTFERTLQSGIEDGILARRIHRLRRYYLDVAPGLADYLAPPAADDGPATVMRQIGITTIRWQTFVNTAGMVRVVNSVIAGILIGVSAHMLAATLLAAVPLGIVAFLLSGVAHHHRQAAAWARAESSVPTSPVMTGDACCLAAWKRNPATR